MLWLTECPAVRGALLQLRLAGRRRVLARGMVGGVAAAHRWENVLLGRVVGGTAVCRWIVPSCEGVLLQSG